MPQPINNISRQVGRKELGKGGCGGACLESNTFTPMRGSTLLLIKEASTFLSGHEITHSNMNHHHKNLASKGRSDAIGQMWYHVGRGGIMLVASESMSCSVA